jgi:hypothetical protein
LLSVPCLRRLVGTEIANNFYWHGADSTSLGEIDLFDGKLTKEGVKCSTSRKAG